MSEENTNETTNETTETHTDDNSRKSVMVSLSESEHLDLKGKADELGMSMSSYVRTQLGLEALSRGARSRVDVDEEKLGGLLKAGVPRKQIAALLGLNVHTVNAHAKKFVAEVKKAKADRQRAALKRLGVDQNDRDD